MYGGVGDVEAQVMKLWRRKWCLSRRELLGQIVCVSKMIRCSVKSRTFTRNIRLLELVATMAGRHPLSPIAINRNDRMWILPLLLP